MNESSFAAVLAHAGVLVERLLFSCRRVGLLPRTSSDDDPLASLCVGDDEVGTMLAGLRGAAAFPDPLAARVAASRAAVRRLLDEPALAGWGLAALVRAFARSDAALDVLIVALAPDWDARLGRLFGFLNNDLSRQRPCLAHLQLLGLDPAALPDPLAVERGAGPGAARTVSAAEHVVRLSRSWLPRAAAAPAWDDLHMAAAAKRDLRAALARDLARRDADRRLILVEGLPGSGRAAVVLAAAAELGLPATVRDLAGEPADAAAAAIAEAALIAHLSGGVAVVRGGGAAAVPALAAQLARHVERLGVRAALLIRPGAIEAAEEGLRFTRMIVARPGPPERRAILAAALGREGVAIAAPALEEVAGRYELTPGRTREVAREVALRAPAAADAALVAATLRDITGQRLCQLAAPYTGGASLADLILPADVGDRLAELTARVRHRYRVAHEWGFAAGGRGGGVTALFCGPSGTGKTVAAGAVARALALDLYVVDLSRVLSKWVGETEQNLARLFDEAEASGAALLFDEADALFGKRSSEIRSASDRYANVTVGYLLSRIETYGGLCFLTTNLESAIDDAFARRLTCRVQFPRPTEDERLQIWRHLVPRGVAFAADVDWGNLVDRFDFTGARIANALARAAYFVAERQAEGPIVLGNDELARAARLEYEDMGRIVPGTSAPRRLAA